MSSWLCLPGSGAPSTPVHATMTAKGLRLSALNTASPATHGGVSGGSGYGVTDNGSGNTHSNDSPSSLANLERYTPFLPRVLLLTRDANLVDIDTATGSQRLIATGVRRMWCVRESVFGGSSGTMVVLLHRGEHLQVCG